MSFAKSYIPILLVVGVAVLLPVATRSELQLERHDENDAKVEMLDRWWQEFHEHDKAIHRAKRASAFNVRFLDQSPINAQLQQQAALPKLTGAELSKAVDEATAKVNKRLHVLEPNIFKNNAMQRPGTFGWLVGATMKSSDLAKNFSRSALIAEEATKILVKRHKLNLDQIAFGLTNLDIKDTSLWRECPKPVQPLSCYPGKYRSYTGHCNNVEHPDWGATDMPFSRSLTPRYADGVSQPRKSITGSELPSPRDVSLAIHQGRESPFSHMTTVTTFFGEFVFHDISHAVHSTGFKGQRLRCCGIKKSDLMHPECLPVKVSHNDPFMSRMQQDCMEFVRSCPAIRNQCSLGPREQINQASSYIDGSAMYGTTKEDAHSLRTLTHGQLKATRLTRSGKEMLPVKEGNDLDCKHAGNMRCFKSGDDRVNENLGLAIIHTIFLREHNRIARRLADINPHWSDEQLYQETRKIIASQIQHITYNEFLPFVIGEEMVDKFNLRLLSEGFYSKYDMDLNPTVDNAVASAVFEFLFTTMPSTMERYSKALNLMGYIKMTDSFFNPHEMYSEKFDEYLLGLISQNAPSSDQIVTDEMTNTVSDNGNEGFDFVASSIQRGRDHGLPGYVEYRTACQIGSNINTFDDLTSIVKGSVLKRLKVLYKDVRDIDLFTGGLAEIPMNGALVGPTFGCLLGRQFDLLRRGDRFWYENDLPPSSFSKDQLSEIRKASLSRILCDNGDQIDFVQPSTMVSSDPYLNAFQYCSTQIFPQIDLDKWKERPFGSHTANLPINSELVNSALIRARREIDDLFDFEHSQGISHLTKSQVMHYSFTRAKRQTITISNQSLVLEKATRGILLHIRRGRDREAGNEILTDINSLVQELPKVALEEYMRRQILTQNQFNDDFLEKCDDYLLPCDHTSPYRSITGWCNNLAHPEWGKSLTIFQRFLPPSYEDGISVPRRHSVTGRLLPSPRLVSFTVHDDVHDPHVRYTLATMQWGQFLDHDVTFTPSYLTSTGQLLNCKACDSPKSVHPECWPIPIPDNDPFFGQSGNGKGRQCLHFVRSMNAQKTLGPRQQMNQLTSFVDGSNIYGSENCEADKLRFHAQGKLNFTQHPIRGHKDLLPQTAVHPECVAPSGICFLAGDLRASEQPSLAAIHTVFMREHNRIAEQLSRINPHWNDEKLYQNARKIVGALVQQITYREWLPRVIGRDFLDRFEISLEQNGYYEGYDAQCNPMFRNEISAAVFRLGHTLLKPSFERLDVNFKTAKRPLHLREAFFNSDMLYAAEAIDELLRGIVTSSIEVFDHSITEEVTNHLFEQRNKPFSGMDLISLNLQRAREHGLQPYNRYREICNLTRARRFEDLSGEHTPKVIEKFRRVYEHVDDIDLFTGGVSEKPLHGALVGPTFSCLLGMQFRALRKCDRYWYETSDKFTRFSEDQLTEIRKMLLAKLICANGDNIPQIQKQALDLPDPFLNPRISCQSLPQMDLTKWRDIESKSCTVSKKTIALGKHRRVSPCVNCVCTSEGPICASIRIQNCKELTAHFSRQEILSDQACMVQCAFTMRNNHIELSSKNMIMAMLTGAKKKK